MTTQQDAATKKDGAITITGKDITLDAGGSQSDAFDFTGVAAEADVADGVSDGIWIDLGYPTTDAETDQRLATDDGGGATADADPLPVLMVIADQQDFYFNE